MKCFKMIKFRFPISCSACVYKFFRLVVSLGGGRASNMPVFRSLGFSFSSFDFYASVCIFSGLSSFLSFSR